MVLGNSLLAGAGIPFRRAGPRMAGHDAVHAAGGRIFLQLWYGGGPVIRSPNDGANRLHPSALAIQGTRFIRLVTHAMPQGALRDDELPGIVQGFRRAAVNAQAAGFDGGRSTVRTAFCWMSFSRWNQSSRGSPRRSDANRARLLMR